LQTRDNKIYRQKENIRRAREQDEGEKSEDMKKINKGKDIKRINELKSETWRERLTNKTIR